jgi:hypothetical protein
MRNWGASGRSLAGIVRVRLKYSSIGTVVPIYLSASARDTSRSEETGPRTLAMRSPKLCGQSSRSRSATPDAGDQFARSRHRLNYSAGGSEGGSPSTKVANVAEGSCPRTSSLRTASDSPGRRRIYLAPDRHIGRMPIRRYKGMAFCRATCGPEERRRARGSMRTASSRSEDRGRLDLDRVRRLAQIASILRRRLAVQRTAVAFDNRADMRGASRIRRATV